MVGIIARPVRLQASDRRVDAEPMNQAKAFVRKMENRTAKALLASSNDAGGGG